MSLCHYVFFKPGNLAYGTNLEVEMRHFFLVVAEENYGIGPVEKLLIHRQFALDSVSERTSGVTPGQAVRALGPLEFVVGGKVHEQDQPLPHGLVGLLKLSELTTVMLLRWNFTVSGDFFFFFFLGGEGGGKSG